MKLIPRLDVGKERLRVVVFPVLAPRLLLSLVTAVVLNRGVDMPEAVLGFTMTASCLFLLTDIWASPVVFEACALLDANDTRGTHHTRQI